MNQNIIFLILILILSANCQFLASRTTSALFLSGENAALIFGIKNVSALISLGLFDKNLVIKNDQYENMRISNDKSVFLKGNSIISNSVKINGNINYLNIPQWKMIYHDSFSKNNTSLEWNFDRISQCNFYSMLGGYCQISDKEIEKEYILPDHSMVKIEALYHFIGKWEWQTGYMKIKKNDQMKYVWSYRCSNLLNGIRLCPDYDVCKLAVPINITIKDSEKNLKVLFGSTLDSHSCDKSYGISDIRIYIK